MKFRTEFPSVVLPQLDFERPILSAGSCFAELIESKLTEGGFFMVPPSHGIVYHPFSISSMLESWTQTGQDWFSLEQNNNKWISLSHHGRFSSYSKESAIQKIVQAQEKCHSALKTAQVLFLSLGTAHCFEDKTTGQPVANCHKLPAARFERKRATAHEIVEKLGFALKALWAVNPDLQVVCSISPVKHLRDGLLENSISKAILRVSIEELCNQDSRMHYFPAYEILMDDLRDYRFYSKDLAHPNEVAKDYIFSYIEKACFSPDVQKIYKEVIKYSSLLGHSSIEEEGQHKQRIEKEREGLISRFPFLGTRI